uniref:Uncharacterized protein n=1 Tax=Nothobranchius furzeri TaxID=105023 RepID=A0A1A8V1C6_NOTFU
MCYFGEMHTPITTSQAVNLKRRYLWKLLYKSDKVMNNLMPKQIQDLFQIRESVYDLRGYKMFRQPKVRTKMKQLCVSCVGVDVWNKLDQEQKDCSTMVKFKGRFKSNVIEYYESSQ